MRKAIFMILVAAVAFVWTPAALEAQGRGYTGATLGHYGWDGPNWRGYNPSVTYGMIYRTWTGQYGQRGIYDERPRSHYGGGPWAEGLPYAHRTYRTPPPLPSYIPYVPSYTPSYTPRLGYYSRGAWWY